MKNTLGMVLATAGLVASSASAQEETEAEAEAEEIALDPGALPSTEPACFSVRGVQTFSALGDEYIYVESTGNSYLLTMERGCFGLRNAENIAFANPVDRVCSNSLAEVSFRGIGGRVESCDILQVESVEDRDAARTLVEIRNPRRR